MDTPYYVTAARYIHNPMRGYPDWSKTIPCVLVLGHLWATHKRKDRQTGDSEKVKTCVPKPNSIPIFFNSCSSIPIQFQFQFFQIQFHSSPVPYPTNSSPILFQFQPVPINSILQFYNSVQFYTRNWTELDLVHPYLQAKRRLFDLWYLTRRVFSSFHL